MRSNSRNLFLALALGAFTVTTVPSWASMMPASQAQATPGSQSMQQQQTEPQQQAEPGTAQPGTEQPGAEPGNQANSQEQSQMQSVSGTIVKSGNEYVLQAADGQEYQLSGASQAESEVGKNVTVTGRVNSSSHSIQVQSIQPE